MKRTCIFLILFIFLVSCRPPFEADESIPQSIDVEHAEELIILRNNQSPEVAPVREETIEKIPVEIPVEEHKEEISASTVEIDRLMNPGGTIIHQQDDLYFVHYFPNIASLKNDESEILLYNLGTQRAQITSSDQKFTIQGRTYEQYSGTWEKFPSFQSWDKIEYVNIKPPYYQGQPLILEPGQKGKLHWHYQFAGDIQGKEQAVEIEIAFTIGGKSTTIEKHISREGE